MPNRYVVVGAGAIGGAIGGRLHQAGRPVVLVARGPHLEAVVGLGAPETGLHRERADGLALAV
ncbi:MAG: hypothetical protein EOP01_01420, partial [Propionibacteriaceae bacterium]